MQRTNFKVTPDLYASKGQRFGNYLIDITIVLVVLAALFFVFTYVYYSVATDTTVMDDYIDETGSYNPLLDRLITWTLLALSYFCMELVLKGKSVGKFITKTKVVMDDGSSPTYKEYLKRSFSRLIPFEQFSFLGDEGRGWHDTISKTYVVDETKFEDKFKRTTEIDFIGQDKDEDLITDFRIK